MDRCIPCAILEIALIAGIGVLIARWSVVAAIVTVGGLAIFGYLRRYHIPGRQLLGPHLVPERIYGLVGAIVSKPPTPAVDPETYLLEAGVLRPDEAGFDLELEPGFRDRWYAAYDTVHDEAAIDQSIDRALLADLVDIEPSRLLIEWYGSAFVAWVDDMWLGQWESRVAFMADIAANSVLSELVPDWSDLPIRQRSTTLGVLRLFIDRCPACDGTVVLEAAVQRSCCSEVDVIATTCRGCGERLFEALADPADLFATVEDEKRRLPPS